jgi:citrate lyase subunit beta/citryl-CoA lyase
MPEALGRLRSALFTPGSEAARLRKAVHAGADICIFDLEDSVTPGRIDDARQAIAQVVPELAGAARIWVRVHAASSSQMAADLAAVPLHQVEGIVLPKVGGKDSVDLCRAGIDAVNGPRDLPLIAIVESAEGVLHAEEIARARAIFCLALGRFDLAADLGIDPDVRTPALSAARAMVVLASAAARRRPPLDSPWLKISDLDGLRVAAEQGRRDGFSGMLLIHPSHVQAVNQIFSPTDEEIAWARRIVAVAGQAAAAGRGAFASDGEMVDKAIVRRARAILANVEP